MLKLNSIAVKLFKRIIFYSILLIIWICIHLVAVDILSIWKECNFPSPVDVAKLLYKLLCDRSLIIAIITTLNRLLIGYLISLVFGLIIGISVIKSKYLDENLRSIFLGLQTLPSICWLPFTILWFGINEKAIIFLVIINSTFSLSMTIVEAIKNVNPLYINVARTLGAKGSALYRTVIFPAALPALISGMKQGWSFSWRAVIAGEMLAAPKGLGQILMLGRDLADMSQVVAIMVVIILIGVIFESLFFGILEKNIRYRFGL